jgi:para-nitrobenzyl esterase
MFSEIASEQPELVLPTEEQLGTAYAGMRVKARGMGIARDIGFRMPSVWLAEGHSKVAPVYLYRFDFSTPMLRLLRIGATHAMELPLVWGNLTMGPKDPTYKLGGRKAGQAVSRRMQARWLNFAAHGKPIGLPDEPEWIPYQETDRASLVIDRTDAVVNDLDRDIRTMWGDKVLNFR